MTSGASEFMGFPKIGGQCTLKERVSLTGIGVHSGKRIGITLCPADSGNGITFLRTNAASSAEFEIRAIAAAVGATEFCTVLGDPRGMCVSTVEHLLAAFFALGVDNAVVEIDGPEVPVMDGSAAAFAEAIDRAGIVVQRAPKRYIRIRKPVRVTMGSAFAEFRPYEGCRFEVGISYDCPVIGEQAIGIDLTPETFRKEIARARTFGYIKDVERLWFAGFALGSSLDNTLVVGDGAVVNPEGLRYPDEFVRHKLLDAIGDLALAGGPIQGLYRSYKGGHKLNAAALSALLSQPDAWTWASAPHERRERHEGRVDILSGLLAPAFAPEVL
jgi:UDP-3-O-[3-hydroxymyristoyl] N-acetylglucosamine deacetylase